MNEFTALADDLKRKIEAHGGQESNIAVNDAYWTNKRRLGQLAKQGQSYEPSVAEKEQRAEILTQKAEEEKVEELKVKELKVEEVKIEKLDVGEVKVDDLFRSVNTDLSNQGESPFEVNTDIFGNEDGTDRSNQ